MSKYKGITTACRKGEGKVKFIFVLLMMSILVGMAVYVYFAWQKKDLTGIDGREQIVSGEGVTEGVDLLKKLQNAHDGNYVVTLSEEEINLYIAKKLKMKQGGPLKGFAKVKGVYVDLTPDHVEVFIEREIAQYGEDGAPKTEYLTPFDHTVSMLLHVYTEENAEDEGTKHVVRFPQGNIGKSPTPRTLVMVMKPSFDAIAEFFDKELELGHRGATEIKVEEGKIILDPRPRYKK